jgi:hypothetical protein
MRETGLPLVVAEDENLQWSVLSPPRIEDKPCPPPPAMLHISHISWIPPRETKPSLYQKYEGRNIYPASAMWVLVFY